MPGFIIGRLVWSGASVFYHRKTDEFDYVGLASQGHILDQYTAFLAYGWHWGGQFLAADAYDTVLQ